jgi:hypothetical protein
MGPMPMPWNTIDVPLVTGWQCTLMPERQYEKLMEWGDGYEDLSARWLYPRAESNEWDSIWNSRPPSDSERAELWDEARLRQLAEDQAAFARLFRPTWDLRTITGGKALREIKTFLRDSLNIAHWNMPKDNADIRRILCQAVADNRLIPIIDRDYEGLPRVALPDPVPLRWPSSDFGGGGSYSGGSSYGFVRGVVGYDEFAALQRANGELSDVSANIASAEISAVIQPQQSLGPPRAAVVVSTGQALRKRLQVQRSMASMMREMIPTIAKRTSPAMQLTIPLRLAMRSRLSTRPMQSTTQNRMLGCFLLQPKRQNAKCSSMQIWMNVRHGMQ